MALFATIFIGTFRRFGRLVGRFLAPVAYEMLLKNSLQQEFEDLSRNDLKNENTDDDYGRAHKKPPKEQTGFAEASETLRFNDRSRTKLWKVQK